MSKESLETWVDKLDQIIGEGQTSIASKVHQWLEDRLEDCPPEIFIKGIVAVVLGQVCQSIMEFYHPDRGANLLALRKGLIETLEVYRDSEFMPVDTWFEKFKIHMREMFQDCFLQNLDLPPAYLVRAIGSVYFQIILIYSVSQNLPLGKAISEFDDLFTQHIIQFVNKTEIYDKKLEDFAGQLEIITELFRGEGFS